MYRKIFVLFLLLFFIFGIHADEREINYGDILVVDLYSFFMVNVNYAITKNINGEKIYGSSGGDGWIRYNTPIDGKYILALDFDPTLGWDWAGEEGGYDFIDTLKDEYEIIDVVQDRYSRMAKVELVGGKKYIIVVELQQYGISE
jgi:hypothetical protein